MTYIDIQETPDDLTEKNKQSEIVSVNKILKKELGKNSETVIVVIEIIETDNKGIAGRTVTQYRNV